MEWVLLGIFIAIVLSAAEKKQDEEREHREWQRQQAESQPKKLPHHTSPGAEKCYFSTHNHDRIRHAHYVPVRANWHIHDAAGTMHPVTPTEDGYIFTNSLGYDVEVITEREAER